MQIEMMSVNELIPYAKNARHNEKAVDKVASSIKEFGFKNPIIVDEKNEIIAGHTRLLAAKKLGIAEVPTIKVDDLTPEQVKAFRIADNKTAEIAEWDFDLLAQELEELKLVDYNLELTGFDFSEAEQLLDSLKDENEQVEEADFEIGVPENPITQKGDLWLLGKHRLMCGDSTDKATVETLMDGKKARLIVTDPPYNVDYTGKTKEALKIENDKMDNNQFYQFLLDSYTRMYEVADDGASIYVFHADSEGLNFRKALIDAGFKLAQCCIWAKQVMVMGRQDYHWMHEPVLYGWKPTAAHYWNSDRKQTTLWHFDRPFRNEHHPTMKPIPLIVYPIKNSSKIGDLVFDPFGGSGSTLIACQETDRICYTMELDEKYADVIVNRYIDYVGSNTDVYLIRNGEKIPYCELVNS
ncbi:DNA modification methylase [Schinkia azotoformans]|uniref:DNA modification methylase n=1 Tax=Schinkia azotoformans TaxID=1454 RepID=UPI002DBC21EA|nr:DNA modification methylase [Schinkia azotoformans]MEC1788624.1 DNA modification methylase [Schinkia azotoformans]MED4419943.1 DNA modification methylase [Schinkia azotoformans]